MNSSIVLAKFLGFFCLILGLSCLINPEHIRAVLQELETSHNAQLNAAILTVILGAGIVAAHNIWKWNWAISITIIGWLMLIGGAFRAPMPSMWVGMFPMVLNSPMLMIAPSVIAVAGLFFLFCGFKRS